VRSIAIGVDADAQEFEPRADARSYRHRPLANPAGEDEDVHSPDCGHHGCRVLAGLVAEELDRLGGVRIGRLPVEQVLHVRADPRNPEQPRLPVNQIVNLLCGHALMAHEVEQEPGIEIAGSGAHDQPGGRSKRHGRVDAFPVANGRHARPRAEVRENQPAAGNVPAGDARELTHEERVGEAVKSIPPDPSCLVASRNGQHAGNRGHVDVKRSVETGHLRHPWEPTKEGADQRDFPRQVVRIEVADSSQVLDQLRGDAFGPDMAGAAVHDAVAHCLHRFEIAVFAEPVDQSPTGLFQIGAFERFILGQLGVRRFRADNGVGDADPLDRSSQRARRRLDLLEQSELDVYTNLMAQKNLLGAAGACQRHQDKARELGVTPEEMAAWRAAAAQVMMPFDDKLGVHQQSEGFTQHEPWNFAATTPEQYPLLLHFAYFDLYRKQVVKQPDLVLAMQLCSNAFTPEQRARNFEYYERITVRDSSLSACSEAVAAADAGHIRLALDYAAEAALMDLHDVEQNARDGLHVASLAGTWIAFVAGFGGMRDHGETLAFAPRLPDGLTRMTFSTLRRGRCLRVDVTTGAASYSLTRGTDPLRITHHGQPLDVTTQLVTRPIPPLPERPPPMQPPGREPSRRSLG
jgi:hypothetical protein